MKLFKKANTTQILTEIIIVLVSFFIILGFIVSSGNDVVTNSDDLACSTLIKSKDTTTFKVIEQLTGSINIKCKKDEIEIKSADENEVFDKISDRMRSCWSRYGEGKVDFLSNFNVEGNWCFTCGTITFDNGVLDSYKYTDLIKWMKENKFEYNDEQISYFDYLNVISVSNGDDINFFKKEFEVLNKEIQEDLSKNKDLSKDDTKLLASLKQVQEIYNSYSKYNNKYINPEEKIFIVYRFDRVESEILSDLSSAVLSDDSTKNTIGGGTGLILTSKSVKSLDIISPQIKKQFSNFGKKIISFIAKKPITSAVLVGVGYAWSEYNTNYNQYVDIMTQEEYYRLCGTEPTLNYK